MKVLIAGDFAPRERVAAQIEAGDYDCLDQVSPIIQASDYSIVNFESPVVKQDTNPIPKIGPRLSCTEKAMECISHSGFKCVTLANNHFRDFGRVGVEDTIEACKKYGVDYVGGGRNYFEAQQIVYKQICGKTLAIINCCEHEFSISTKDAPGSNPLNPIQQFYAIREARNNADYVLLIAHGGHEMWQLPSPRMQEAYRFFVDVGADAVVNHHQHCYSGYEFYKKKPIVYGLGNFCFDKQGYSPTLWCFGYMVAIDFSDDVKIELYPFEQCGKVPNVSLLSNRDLFDERIQYLNDIISSPVKLKNETDAYYKKNSKNILLTFEPYTGRLQRKIYSMGCLPTFLGKKKKLKLLNLLQCESHRDKVLYILSQDNNHDE